MKNKYYDILEFNIIIDKIKNYARLKKTKEELDDYSLLSNIEDITNELNITDEASKIIYRYGLFPLYFETNINEIFDKTNKCSDE